MYQALYRKWRPRTFEDVVGQSHITETLRQQAVWPFSWILRLSYSVAPLPYHTRRILSTSGGHLFSHSGISVYRSLFFVQSALKRGILPGSRLCFPSFKFFIDKFPRI